MPLIEPGSKAPAFSLKDQEGHTHKLSDYDGRPRRAVLLSQGRHAWLHRRGMRLPRQPAPIQAREGGDPGGQHPGREQQGQVR